MPDEEEEAARYQQEDVVQKQKFDYLGVTGMLENFPELDCKVDAEDNPANKTTVVAPGEGKVPTNISRRRIGTQEDFPASTLMAKMAWML